MNGSPVGPGDAGPTPARGGFDRGQWVALALITLTGAALRIALAWDHPRLGDEVGTLLNLRRDAGYLLTHFSGMLTMNYFILAEKGVARLFGSEGWPLEILPMLGGIATIPLTASLARRLGGGRLGLTAAALTAFNPYLVDFSPVLRAYSLLAALAVWAVNLFFHWRAQRTWRTGTAAAGVILVLLSMHPNGIYVVMGLGVLVAAEACGRLIRAEGQEARVAYLTGLWTFLVPLAGAGLATWLAYRGVAADVQRFTLEWSATPPTGLEYVPTAFAMYFGRGFPLFVPAGLLVAGVWSATQARKELLPLCVLVGLSPVFVSLKGVSHFPGAYARFQIYCVPLMLILMAEGIVWLTARRRHPMATGAVALMAILCWLPPLADLFAENRDNAMYARTAAYLCAQRHPGDLIVIEGVSPFLQMTPLLPQGEGGPVRAQDFVKRRAGLGEGGRVLFVAPDDPALGTSGTRHLIGKLQVVDYPGPTDAVCARLREDLARVADGHVDPDLGGDYQLLALLDKDRSVAREWELLAQLCRAQTTRFRLMPEQMRARAVGNVARPRAHSAPEPDN